MKVQVRKDAVDRRVAVELGLPADTVAIITKCFLRQALELLAEHGELKLPGFGRLKVLARTQRIAGFPIQHVVFFKKATAMTEAIKARSKEVPYGEVRGGRISDAGPGEASSTGLSGVREEA